MEIKKVRPIFPYTNLKEGLSPSFFPHPPFTLAALLRDGIYLHARQGFGEVIRQREPGVKVNPAEKLALRRRFIIEAPRLAERELTPTEGDN